MTPATIGVDVGGTSTRVVTLGADGTIGRIDVTRTPHGPEALVEHLRTIVGQAVAGGHADLVGVGVPGRVDASSGTVDVALNLGILAPVDVRAALAPATSATVVVENDVNAAAIGAAAALGLGERANLAFVSIGTGLAAGHVVDGRVVRGATGAAGEIGHLPVPGADVVCACGQRGCLEAVASGGGMLRRWARPDADVGTLWDAADAGDADAARVRDDAVTALAWATQLEVLTLDVEHVVLGGGVSRLGRRLLSPVVAAMRDAERSSGVLAALSPSSRVRLAPAGVELGALGAACAARLATGRPPVAADGWAP